MVRLKNVGILLAGVVISGGLVYGLLTVRESSVNQSLSNTDKALEIIENIEEVRMIRKGVEKAGNKLLFMPEGEQNGEVTITLSEGLSDHLSRIATFYVDVPTAMVTVEDVVQAKRISIEKWKMQIRNDWGF